MTVKHPTKNIAIHIWGWKSQPDLQSIAEIIVEFQLVKKGTVNMLEIDGNSDFNCVAIYIDNGELSENFIKSSFSFAEDWAEGLSPEELDWQKAAEHLTEKRIEAAKMGIDGIHLLNNQLNNLLIEVDRGVRTTELFNKIMEIK